MALNVILTKFQTSIIVPVAIWNIYFKNTKPTGKIWKKQTFLSPEATEVTVEYDGKEGLEVQVQVGGAEWTDALGS